MRLDRLLCEMNIGSRSQVKDLIKKGQIAIDGILVKKPETQVDEAQALITFQGKEYRYSPYVYYMMNKPAGVITATRDEQDKTVLDLLKECLSRKNPDLTGIPIREIAPVGRLDKDTVGLLLLTNDGKLAHELLAPAKHVPKKYFVRTCDPVTDAMKQALEAGVLIGADEKTKPAQVEILNDHTCHITITEGKFHQVKRMFHAVGTEVVYLKRLSMGSLVLDEQLPEGGVRELTQEEVQALCSKT